jgi:hypothetical protein
VNPSLPAVGKSHEEIVLVDSIYIVSSAYRNGEDEDNTEDKLYELKNMISTHIYSGIFPLLSLLLSLSFFPLSYIADTRMFLNIITDVVFLTICN